jgi:hypothetical protein
LKKNIKLLLKKKINHPAFIPLQLSIISNDEMGRCGRARVVWWVDLQLPVRAVPMTNFEYESRKQHCVIKFDSDLWEIGVFSGFSGFLHQ